MHPSFPCSSVIREWLRKKIQIEKKKKFFSHVDWFLTK